MMGSMMGGGQGQELLVARFNVTAGSPTHTEPPSLPEAQSPVRAGKTELHTRLSFQHMQGLLGGRAFEMNDIASDEHLPLMEEAVWTFSNDPGGMAMPHPMHIHGVRFRILERSSRTPADLHEGLIDVGYQDTLLVFPGERVRVAVAPTEPGMFMYHCHNLEHEDGGMMRNCWFGSGPAHAG